jgi:outer membrane lipoprotein
MVGKFFFYFLLFSFIFTTGCAQVISKDLRAKTDLSLAFSEVSKNANSYKGKIVIWGGEIIQAIPQEDGTNLIEVLQWPLGWREKPKRTVSFHGKFLVLSKEPLDLSLYRRGIEITVAGEIEGSVAGEKIKSVSDSTYRYPLVLSKEIHLWKDRSYSYSSLPYYRGASEYRYGGILRY